MSDPVTFVGESNPYSSDPHHALLPWPAGATGDRLCAILGIPHREYVSDYARVNLCVGVTWSTKMARESARRLLSAGGPLVLLGSKVCLAFGVRYDPFEVKTVWPGLADDPVSVLVLPHPSGLNRAWNAPSSREAAREAFARFLLVNSSTTTETADAEDKD